MRLWSGVTSVMLGCIPAHACYFTIYELSKAFFGIQPNSDVYLFSTMATGAMATLAHDCFMTPMDVVKQRMQLNGTHNPILMLQTVVRTEGAVSLYRSLPVTLVSCIQSMNLPVSALFMTLYENIKSQVFPSGNVSLLGYFSCAGVSASMTAGLTTPIDVIKTRIQT